MTAIITQTELNKFKRINLNIRPEIYLNYIIEAQEKYLRPVLGDEFYIDILKDAEASPSRASYKDLIEGCYYDSDRNKHEGLIAVLSHYTYAIYLNAVDMNSTPYGIVQKKTDYSEPTDYKRLAANVTHNLAMAESYMVNVIKYIRHEGATVYPLFKENLCDGGRVLARGIHTRVIGK